MKKTNASKGNKEREINCTILQAIKINGATGLIHFSPMFYFIAFGSIRKSLLF